MGDIERIYSPIIVHNAFASGSSAFIGNHNDKSTKPSFIYANLSEIGSTMVVCRYNDIHPELRPEEPLSPRTIADTSWASAKVKLGMVQFPMVALIFFQQKSVTCSIHDADFDNQLGEISPSIHLRWAQLMRELLTQEENVSGDLDLVVQRLLKSRGKNDNAKMVTASFGIAQTADSTFLSTFILPPEKWVLQQTPLRKFVVGIPSPTRTGQQPTSDPNAPTVSFEPDKDSNLGETPQLSTAAKNQSSNLANEPFDPMAFLKLWGDKMQLLQQQPQTIVVELRADKSRETEAKFNNHMLLLFLISGDVDFSPPGTFAAPPIPTYTQAMVNVLSQPSLVRGIHAVNILTTCFNQVPTDLAERLSPLTTHKSMNFISKNFATLFITANIQRTPLETWKFKTSSFTILSFVGQNDFEKIEAHCEAEQLNENSILLIPSVKPSRPPPKALE
jgi:hypothetical protein